MTRDMVREKKRKVVSSDPNEDGSTPIPQKKKRTAPTNTSLLPPCKVCEEPAAGFHYGVNTCEACKGFFRRTLVREGDYDCINGDEKCPVVQAEKSSKKRICPRCRHLKCLTVGMSQEAIKTGRYTHAKRTQDIIEYRQVMGLSDDSCSTPPPPPPASTVTTATTTGASVAPSSTNGVATVLTGTKTDFSSSSVTAATAFPPHPSSSSYKDITDASSLPSSFSATFFDPPPSFNGIPTDTDTSSLVTTATKAFPPPPSSSSSKDIMDASSLSTSFLAPRATIPQAPCNFRIGSSTLSSVPRARASPLAPCTFNIGTSAPDASVTTATASACNFNIMETSPGDSSVTMATAPCGMSILAELATSSSFSPLSSLSSSFSPLSSLSSSFSPLSPFPSSLSPSACSSGGRAWGTAPTVATNLSASPLVPVSCSVAYSPISPAVPLELAVSSPSSTFPDALSSPSSALFQASASSIESQSASPSSLHLQALQPSASSSPFQSLSSQSAAYLPVPVAASSCPAVPAIFTPSSIPPPPANVPSAVKEEEMSLADFLQSPSQTLDFDGQFKTLSPVEFDISALQSPVAAADTAGVLLSVGDVSALQTSVAASTTPGATAVPLGVIDSSVASKNLAATAAAAKLFSPYSCATGLLSPPPALSALSLSHPCLESAVCMDPGRFDETRSADTSLNSNALTPLSGVSSPECPLSSSSSLLCDRGGEMMTEEECRTMTKHIIQSHNNCQLSNLYSIAPDELLRRQQLCHDTYMARVEAIGPMGVLSEEEYQAVYQTTGIDLDNRQDFLTVLTKMLDEKIRDHIAFVKTIPGFSDLKMVDQIRLLKDNRAEMGCICQSTGYNHELRVSTMPSGRSFHQEELRIVGGKLHSEMRCQAMHAVCKLGLSHGEKVLFKCLALFTQGKEDLDQPEKVNAILWRVTQCLLWLLKENGRPNPNLFLARVISVQLTLKDMSAVFYTWIKTKPFAAYEQFKNNDLLAEWFSSS